MDTYDTNLSERILGSFNQVFDSDEIFRRIYDNPNYGASSREAYGISPDIAQKIPAARNALPDRKFVSLQEINDIRGVSSDTFHDILCSFHRVREISHPRT